MNTIVSENPLKTRNFYHSSSYESKYQNTTSNPNSFDREQSHSQESSSSTIHNRNRSPSPITGYTSSTTTTTGTTSSTYKVGSSGDPTSPLASFVPQYDYRNVSFLFIINKIFYLKFLDSNIIRFKFW